MNTHSSDEMPFLPRTLGRTTLNISLFGFGGYRIDDRTRTHSKALHMALERGCNLIDTSSNYADGHSEILVGKVVNDLIASGKITRENVMVVSKAGYIQGSNLKVAQERKASGVPFSDVVECSSDLWHCISPDFLEDQLDRSLSRLNLKHIDVFLLHNPEYFFKTSHDQHLYYQRISKAFSFLEEKVKEGKISHYGISSNTFVDACDSSSFTSLEKVIQCAEQISLQHHFSVIQCPFNLFESGALTEKNNSGKTVFELARANNLGIMINRPLNAFVNHQLLRLANFNASTNPELEQKLKSALEVAMKHEKEFPMTSEEGPLLIGHILNQQVDRIEDMTVWKEIFSYQVSPLLDRSFKFLDTMPDIQAWANPYKQNAVALVEVFTEWVENNSAEKSKNLFEWLSTFFEAVPDHTSLSQLVLALYAELPEISCILVGMREQRYVEDVLTSKPLKLKVSAQDVFTKVKTILANPQV